MSCTRDTPGPHAASKCFTLATGKTLSDDKWHKAVAEADLNHGYDPDYRKQANPEDAYQRMLLMLAVEGKQGDDISPGIREYLNAIRSGEIPMSNRHVAALIYMRYAERGDYNVTKETEPDGTELITYPSGKIVRKFPSGTISTTEGNGRNSLYSADGEKRVMSEDGGYYIDKPDHTRVYVNADGEQRWNGTDEDGVGFEAVVSPDGTEFKYRKDGSTRIVHPDGRVTTSTSRWDENGYLVMESTSDYGTVTSVDYPDGGNKMTYHDGEVRIVYGSGHPLSQRYEHPNGATETFYDGGSVRTYPNGDVYVRKDKEPPYIRHADGMRTVLNSEGNGTLYDADGVPVPASRMERILTRRQYKEGRIAGGR